MISVRQWIQSIRDRCWNWVRCRFTRKYTGGGIRPNGQLPSGVTGSPSSLHIKYIIIYTWLHFRLTVLTTPSYGFKKHTLLYTPTKPSYIYWRLGYNHLFTRHVVMILRPLNSRLLHFMSYRSDSVFGSNILTIANCDVIPTHRRKRREILRIKHQETQGVGYINSWEVQYREATFTGLNNKD